MKFARIVPVLLGILFAAAPAWAHKPLLSVEDNGDGTIYIEVGFSDGSSGAGHKIVIKDKASGNVIQEHKVPAEGSLDLPMPNVPYIVIFDAGEGHTVEQVGPFTAPKDNAAAEATAVKPDVSEPAPLSPPAAPASLPQQLPQLVAPQAAPVLLASAPSGPGVEMALKMMLATQIVTAVLAAFLFGAAAFWIGYSVGKSRTSDKR